MRRPMTVKVLLVLLLLLTVETCRGAEPYDNIAMPQGSYFSTYPLFCRATRLMDKNGDVLPVDPDLDLYQNTFKYTYYNKTLLPNTTSFATLLPVGYVNLLDDHAGGIGDLTLVGGYWLVDDPLAKTWFGARLQLIAPIGGYDKDSKANMGGNVWKFRPVLYFAKQSGNIQLELTAKYSFQTTNSATDTRQGNEVIVEGYGGYFPSPDLLLGLHVNGTLGRDKTVSGDQVPDSGVRVLQAGPSLLKNFGKGFSVTVEALSDFAVRNSTAGHTVLARLSWKL